MASIKDLIKFPPTPFCLIDKKEWEDLGYPEKDEIGRDFHIIEKSIWGNSAIDEFNREFTRYIAYLNKNGEMSYEEYLNRRNNYYSELKNRKENDANPS